MNESLENLDTTNIPAHVAIIMDGNGRWAKQCGKNRLYGHQNAILAIRQSTEFAAEIGIKYLTLYAFSNENWCRPEAEVQGLMELLILTIEAETPTLHKNNVRLLSIGDTNRLPDDAHQRLAKCIETTSQNTGLSLVLALSYSSRWEIVEATKQIALKLKRDLISPEDITEELFSSYLTTHSIPDPDLLIRTSGEYRISNFLLWQISYAELYFSPIFWPDFTKDDFKKALLDYQQRERRYGKTSDQV
ncbi:MAG: isoprenyl transferase [Paludibacteraceae bacterium]|nr:isoprenyl transferase [Paludibacteraceae bacterium]MBP6283824.1 isoprenyl transferase [Paludibacteraceae bacterium]